MSLSPLEAIQEAQRVVASVEWLDRYAEDLDAGQHPGLASELHLAACGLTTATVHLRAAGVVLMLPRED